MRLDKRSTSFKKIPLKLDELGYLLPDSKRSHVFCRAVFGWWPLMFREIFEEFGERLSCLTRWQSFRWGFLRIDQTNCQYHFGWNILTKLNCVSLLINVSAQTEFFLFKGKKF